MVDKYKATINNWDKIYHDRFENIQEFLNLEWEYHTTEFPSLGLLSHDWYAKPLLFDTYLKKFEINKISKSINMKFFVNEMFKDSNLKNIEDNLYYQSIKNSLSLEGIEVSAEWVSFNPFNSGNGSIMIIFEQKVIDELENVNDNISVKYLFDIAERHFEEMYQTTKQNIK
ncbi:hypothetical protein ACQKL5_10815 [Peribacillus sp. NPDC097675]|uniref:hypothetical protein n=1 Tax=Peribacillus sp. NPDC097675 TaxID=3390618 RepID=UPI003D045D07